MDVPFGLTVPNTKGHNLHFTIYTDINVLHRNFYTLCINNHKTNLCQLLKGCFAASGTCDLYKVDGIMKNLRVLKQNLKPSSRAEVGMCKPWSWCECRGLGDSHSAKSVLCQKTHNCKNCEHFYSHSYYIGCQLHGCAWDESYLVCNWLRSFRINSQHLWYDLLWRVLCTLRNYSLLLDQPHSLIVIS